MENLTANSEKVLSKTAKQILSLVVSRIPYIEDKAEKININGISLSNKLQETYSYFERNFLGSVINVTYRTVFIRT